MFIVYSNTLNAPFIYGHTANCVWAYQKSFHLLRRVQSFTAVWMGASVFLLFFSKYLLPHHSRYIMTTSLLEILKLKTMIFETFQ